MTINFIIEDKNIRTCRVLILAPFFKKFSNKVIKNGRNLLYRPVFAPII